MINTVNKLNSVLMNRNLLLVSCNNSQDLEDYGQKANNLNVLFAGVQFDNSLAGDKPLPSDLNVTLR